MDKELQKMELKTEFRDVQLGGKPAFYRYNE